MSEFRLEPTGPDIVEGDFVETPAKTVRALLDVIGDDWAILDPCCGRGAILEVAGARGVGIEADPGRAAAARGFGHAVRCGDGLDITAPEWRHAEAVICNPPYSGRQAYQWTAAIARWTFSARGRVGCVLLPAASPWEPGWLPLTERALIVALNHRPWPVEQRACLWLVFGLEEAAVIFPER